MKIVSFLIAMAMIFTGFMSVINLSAQETADVLAEFQEIPDTFSVYQNGVEYSMGNFSQSEIDKMKDTLGVREPGRNYNVMVGDKGTGLAPPTEEGWEKMLDTTVVRDIISLDAELPSSCDFSTEPYFPAVGNQLSQGSCCAWAITYYTYGYLEAKDNNWTDAKTGNPEHLMSPGWTYNMVNEGFDGGSWECDNADVIEDWGVPNLVDRPYEYTDPESWGGEDAFRGAPLHRARQDYFIPYSGDPTVELVKSIVSGSVPVTFSIDADKYLFDGDFILSSSEYESDHINHVQTIVGYNDFITDDGDFGAFRVVNSWGAGFGDNGYYWITYEAFKEIGEIGELYLTYLEDEPDYVPSTLATWEFSTTPSIDEILVLGIMEDSSIVQSKMPFFNVNYYLNHREFPDFMCLDISEFESQYHTGLEKFYFCMGETSIPGTLSSFRLERYDDGYEPYLPDYRSAVSADVPLNNSCTAYLNAPLVQNLNQSTYHTSIQKAVDNASAGDALFIPSGTYFENVQVPLTLTIEGQGMMDTIVDARSQGSAMEIIADSVDISALSFINSGDVSGDAGLKLFGAEDCQIIACQVISNENGFLLEASDNNSLYHNNIINNVISASDAGANSWDNGYPSGGNYWSDLPGPVDSFWGPAQDIPGSDDISDISYSIPGGPNEDNYPLIGPVFNNRLSHAPINIESNADFDFSHGVVAGDGSESNPWLIENWEINGADYAQPCISISNTDDYYEINGCNLHDAQSDQPGVKLFNAPNGIVQNTNSSSNLGSGIDVEGSSNILILDNLFTSNYVGIITLDTENLTISRNQIMENLGMQLGIWSTNLRKSIISDNQICNNNGDGIGLEFCNGNTVTNNHIWEEYWDCIYLYECYNTTITYNEFNGGQYCCLGIYVDILGTNTNNTIYHNIFINDMDFAYDDAVNHWDNGYPDGGNFWSDNMGTDVFMGPNQNITGNDGICDSPYVIGGSGANQDNYPLMIPWEFTPQTFSISLDAGWNLISIPLKQTDTSVENVLNSINGQYDAVKYYDSTDINSPWKTYRPGAPTNSLFDIDHKMGFWIHMLSPETLMVQGLPLDSTDITLHAGWNIVSYPSMSSDIVSNTLIGTGADRVEAFDIADPYLIKEVGSMYMMQAGEGYWVHVPADTTWTIDW